MFSLTSGTLEHSFPSEWQPLPFGVHCHNCPAESRQGGPVPYGTPLSPTAAGRARHREDSGALRDEDTGGFRDMALPADDA